MKTVRIENPILNGPFEEPTRHFKFNDDGITNEIVDGRRRSSYLIPIAGPKKKGKAASMFDDEAEQKNKDNDEVNRIRQRVTIWRERGYPDITSFTRALMDHWKRDDRPRRLFFCQIEALETLIYLTEAADKNQDEYLLEAVRKHNRDAGTQLFRMACKMATGTGKTVLMGMIIAWQTLNRRAYPRDKRFTDTFLIVTPGITIRDRLRVLLPSEPENYYKVLDLVPPEYMRDLGSAKIVISNFHAFKPKEKGDAGRLTKYLLQAEKTGAFTESPEEMVNRVCRDLGTNRGIIVMNDEAHHCYRSKPSEEKLTGDERKEAQNREEEARLWLTGLEAIHAKLGVKTVYDVSATPFYLKGSGYPEGTLFPWVVSDFALIDAIESGIVKIPRVPVADDSMTGDLPTYRELWLRIRDSLPKKGRGTDAVSGPPQLHQVLEGALQSLYEHYEKKYREWEADTEAHAMGRTPPVFIVVCNNTNVSKLVFDYIAGHETGKEHPDGTPYYAPGKLPIFGNVVGNRLIHRPNTILVDSEQLESDEGMSADFKKVMGPQIEDFKAEYRRRFPGKDVENIADEDLMREVLNTVGKSGKLGENIKCVVSVSMLTEGWDANTVTHILGVRAFGTQLLCEQVVGRGLRRMSYTVNDDGKFDPEYAEVYGVPFTFIPCAGIGSEKSEGTPKPGRVKFLPERVQQCPWLNISFPRVIGYRYDLPGKKLDAAFSAKSTLVLSTADIPTRVENAPIVGETAIHTLDELKKRRPQEVAFAVARLVRERFFKDDAWIFPQVLDIVKKWMDAGHIKCKDDTFPQLVLFMQKANEAAEKVYQAIVASTPGEARLRAEVQPYDPVGGLSHINFDSRKEMWTTQADKCPINFVPIDSGWEGKFAQVLESLKPVKAYAKNQNIGFRIPYTFEGIPKSYYPDFLVKIDDGRGADDLLNLVVEVSGQKKPDKDQKVNTATGQWVPAVNNEGTFGRWAFFEVTDPYQCKNELKSFLDGL